jgi:hypothetical protein
MDQACCAESSRSSGLSAGNRTVCRAALTMREAAVLRMSRLSAVVDSSNA